MGPDWHVGDVIRKLREARRWNQLRLAKEANLNKATVVRVEEHASGIKRETYEAVSRAFGLSVGELFSMVPGQETQRAIATSAAAGPPFRDSGWDGRVERRGPDAGPPAGVIERRRSTGS